MIHWYPASFITAIPGNIIDIFSDPGEIVWDPFCGCGTSATEAFRKGRHFYGNDISEIGILISLSKLLLLANRSRIEEEFRYISVALQQLDFELSFNISQDDYVDCGRQKCSYNELKQWYNKQTLRDLFLLRGFLERNLKDKQLKIVFLTIFLNIAKLACAQQKTWGHIADNVLPTKDQIADKKYAVISNFIKRLGQIQKQAQRILLVSSEGSYQVKVGDVRTYSPPKPVDLVITSPPYPSMTDYITSQRLDYYWLGYTKDDITTLKKKEIGPRYLRHNSAKNTLYFENMKLSLANIIKSIKSEGLLVLILPDYDDNEPRKRVIDNLYTYLNSAVNMLYRIPRNVDEMNRWAPFRRLKRETLTVWSKR
jgi:DNA modification methylase